LEKPISGEVTVDGKVVNRLSPSEMRRHRESIGMIFQHFNLISCRNVFQNVAYPLKIAGKRRDFIESRVGELLKLVDLEDKKLAYPAKLSGGQKQRVGIARALANDTRILLCDEPTSALDVETAKVILQLLERLAREFGITIVVITHELSVVSAICDCVAVMSEGRVVEIGDTYDVFTNPREEYTKKLLDIHSDFHIPDEIMARMREKSAVDGLYWKITRLNFIGEAANESVITSASRLFETDINVIHGKIDYIRGKPYGRLFLCLRGERDEVEAAASYLSGRVHSMEILYEQ
jgi:D-methionine transport system ATP-binding protein